MNKNVLFLIYFFAFFQYGNAQDLPAFKIPFKKYLKSDWYSDEKKVMKLEEIRRNVCSTGISSSVIDSNSYQTKGYSDDLPIYDAFTALSFWGDSRADWVASPMYGWASLDAYFGTNGEWNVQNFGVAGRQSAGLMEEIRECFQRETRVYSDPNNPNHPKPNDPISYTIKDADVLKPFYQNFKVSNNVAFEIGGNDFVGNLVTLYILPTMMASYLDKAADNIYYTLKYLRLKERNVLVVGNYPAVSWSLKLGHPRKYAWDGIWNLKNFTMQTLRGDSLTADEQIQYTLRYLLASENAFIGLILKPVLILLRQSNLFNSPHLNEEFDKIINDPLGTSLETVLVGNDQREEVEKNLVRGSYKWWLYIAKEAPGTIASLGVTFLEPRIQQILSDESKFSAEYYAGTKMHYLPVWPAFLHPLSPYEAYVVNPALMSDLIHPNALGFAVWGSMISGKIKALGWDKNYKLGNSTFSDIADMNEMFALEKIRIKYQARLALIKKELDAKIALINQQITDLDTRIEAIKEAIRQAELAREQARLQKEAEDAAARLAAEQERLRLAAEEQKRRELAQKQADEEKRIRDEQEALRLKRENDERVLLIASCVFFGICKR